MNFTVIGNREVFGCKTTVAQPRKIISAVGATWVAFKSADLNISE